jgi:hypothetical protein
VLSVSVTENVALILFLFSQIGKESDIDMALSGTFYTNVNSHWRLQGEWSATQNIAGNYSDVTLKVYWMGTTQYGTTYSTVTKDGSSTINGSSDTFTSSAKLTGAEKKLIQTHTVRVNHDADGAKTFSMSAWFDVELTLSGTQYNRVSISSGTVTLNTIPRQSTLSSSRNWTAPNSLAINIARASSSFTHDLTIKVNGKVIKYLYGIGTSTTVNWTDTENTWIFEELAKDTINFNQTSEITLTTKSGSTTIGSQTYTGTVSSPSATTTTIQDGFTVGDTFSVGINRSNSKFTHTVRLQDNTTFIKEYTNVGASLYFDTSDVADAFYDIMTNTSEEAMSMWTYTYFNGVQVRQPYTETVTAIITNAEPIFNATGVAYKDISSSTVTITGNDQYIVQNKSSVEVTLPSSDLAQGQKGASIVEYIATLAGEQQSTNHTGSTVTFSFGTINASANQTLSIRARDSRGFEKEVTKTVLVVPYSQPSMNAKAERRSGFEEITPLTLGGNIYAINVADVNKNSIQNIQYRWKESTGVFTDWINFLYSTNASSFTVTPVNMTFDSTKSYVVEFSVQDRFGTYVASRTVAEGTPIMFIDPDKKSVGIGKFPDNPNSLEIAGTFNAENLSATKLVAENAEVDEIVIGKDTSTPNTIKQSGYETRVENGDGYHISLEPINSSYSEIQTNSALIDFMSPVRFYSGDVTVRNKLNADGDIYLASAGAIYTKSNNDYIIKDHGNGNVTHSASGGLLFLGYSNTTEIIASTQFRPIADGEITGWSNGWKAYSTGSSGFAPRYTKTVEGVVILQGLMNGTGTMASGNGTPAFRLPSGCRPLSTILAYVTGYGGRQHRFNILADGWVNIIDEGDDFASWVSLNGIAFQALQ